MRNVSTLKTIFSAIGIKTAAFTAATTDVITSAAHGLNNNDMVVLTTTGTLPAGLATSTVYYVVESETDTYKLVNKSTNVPVDITGTGSGTHTWTMHDVGHAINVEHYKNHEITLATDGGGDAAMKVYFLGSYQEDAPDFSAAKSVTNHFEHIAVRDRQDNSVIAGDTGITLSGADDYRAFNVETNNLVWICAIISDWTAGEITLKVKSSNDS